MQRTMTIVSAIFRYELRVFRPKVFNFGQRGKSKNRWIATDLPAYSENTQRELTSKFTQRE